MNVEMENSGDRRPGIIEIYATRLSRLYYLKQLCYDEHPVLTTEIHLVEMAKAKLQEYILIYYPDFKSQSEMRSKVRNAVIEKIKLHHQAIDSMVSLFIDEHLSVLFDPN